MEENIDEKHLIKIDNFEGPFDLLCYLIDKNKMDIFDIKLDEVTNQYITYLENMEKYNIEIASQFLVMASTLIYLKSKRLLPKLEPEETEELTEEELARRILEYKLYKEVSTNFKERFLNYCDRINKAPDNITLPKQKIEKQFDKLIIPNTYYSLIKRNDKFKNINYENINKLAEYESITVRRKAKDIIKELIKKPRIIFNQLFVNKKVSKLETVTSFLGLLELAKIKRISIVQEQSFGDIIVEKRKK